MDSHLSLKNFLMVSVHYLPLSESLGWNLGCLRIKSKWGQLFSCSMCLSGISLGYLAHRFLHEDGVNWGSCSWWSLSSGVPSYPGVLLSPWKTSGCHNSFAIGYWTVPEEVRSAHSCEHILNKLCRVIIINLLLKVRYQSKGFLMHNPMHGVMEPGCLM